MPLPLAPVAVVAVRYGAMALVAYGLARRARNAVQMGRTDQRAEDAMDATVEGVTLHPLRDADQLNATARLRRVIRWGRSGAGIEIDATALTRLRIRRV